MKRFCILSSPAMWLTSLLLLVQGGCSPILNKPPSRQTGVKTIRDSEDDQRCPLQFSELELCAELRPMESSIRVRRATSFQLYFWSSSEGTPSGPYMDPGHIPGVWLWMEMPTGSHGSSPITVESSFNERGEIQTGVYNVRNMVFTMSGEWEIHIELKTQDGTIADEVQQQIWI